MIVAVSNIPVSLADITVRKNILIMVREVNHYAIVFRDIILNVTPLFNTRQLLATVIVEAIFFMVFFATDPV